jgi:hypothetical protein
MSAVISGSIGIFVPFFVFVSVLFMYLHTIWLKNAYTDHGYGNKGAEVYPQNTVDVGISDFLGAVGGTEMPKDGTVHGWQGSEAQYGSRPSVSIRENPYKNSRISANSWNDDVTKTMGRNIV